MRLLLFVLRRNCTVFFSFTHFLYTEPIISHIPRWPLWPVARQLCSSPSLARATACLAGTIGVQGAPASHSTPATSSYHCQVWFILSLITLECSLCKEDLVIVHLERASAIETDKTLPVFFRSNRMLKWELCLLFTSFLHVLDGYAHLFT